MAAAAKEDQSNRTVIVRRSELLEQLNRNLEQHRVDYDEAIAGYKSQLLSKIEAEFEKAKETVKKSHENVVARVNKLNSADIPKQRDTIPIIDSIYISMKVPRSYASEYEAAIDMFRWDVRDTVELTYAEFTCFVRDQWDWKGLFNEISTMYKM